MTIPTPMATLAPLYALAMALLGAALMLGAVWRSVHLRRRDQAEHVARLEQAMAAQRSALERSEAARERAEAELRAAEQRYLLAVRGSQDGLWEWELASGVVQLSPRWKSMLGFESDEIADRLAAWRERIHPDDRARFEQAVQRHLAAATPHLDIELRLLHKDGSVRHVLSRGVAITRESGDPYRVVGLDTDVTALRRVQAVLDAVADGTAGTSGDGFFSALAEHFARALDVDRAFITECANTPPTRVRTLGYWSKRQGARESFEFELAGTPCEEVVQGGRMCFHREGVARMFPREVGLESYLGLPITGSRGQVLGHLAFFDTRQRSDDLLVERVYRIFVARAAAEIERRHALAR